MASRIRRMNNGSIKIAEDDRGNACYVCESRDGVIFLEFASPRLGDRMFLRVCLGCLNVVYTAVTALKGEPDGEGTLRRSREHDHVEDEGKAGSRDRRGG